MPLDSEPMLPRDEFSLNAFHERVATSLERGLVKAGKALSRVFGPQPAADAFKALLTASPQCSLSAAQLEIFDQPSWVDNMEDLIDSIDSVDMTQPWRDAADYAGTGAICHDHGANPSLESRREWIEKTIEFSKSLAALSLIVGHDFDHVWEASDARHALDFGGTLTIEGLRLVSGLSMPVMRNAINSPGLRLNCDNTVPSDVALEWLKRRREFWPSRWTNLSDDQQPFSPEQADKPNKKGTILVPQSADGDRFEPDLVVRTTRGATNISIMIGAKGHEEQHHGFYDALKVLARMDVARWRRRNSTGNWGIVRARGAWVAVSKAEIDRQLAAKLAEVA